MFREGNRKNILKILMSLQNTISIHLILLNMGCDIILKDESNIYVIFVLLVCKTVRGADSFELFSLPATTSTAN